VHGNTLLVSNGDMKGINYAATIFAFHITQYLFMSIQNSLINIYLLIITRSPAQDYDRIGVKGMKFIDYNYVIILNFSCNYIQLIAISFRTKSYYIISIYNNKFTQLQYLYLP